MIKAYGRAGVFDAALALIVGTYATLDERLQAIRHNHPEHDIVALVEVLSELQFQPGPADNYYLQCLA